MKRPPLIGSYRTLDVEVGDFLIDFEKGIVEVGGYTDALIPWPRVKKRGKHSLILTGALINAVMIESVKAIAYYWGVGATTVWHWRKLLGVDRVNDGTRLELKTNTGVPDYASKKGRDRAKSPESINKMRESKSGVKMHPNTKDALIKAVKQPKPAGFGIMANARMLRKQKGSKKRCTDSDVELIKRLYSSHGAEYLAERLGVTKAQIMWQVTKHGLKKEMSPKAHWTGKEDEFIRLNYVNLGPVECAFRLGRTEAGVRIRASNLGVKRGKRIKGRPWSKEEVEFLLLNHDKLTIDALISSLNRSKAAIEKKAFLLEIKLNRS